MRRLAARLLTPASHPRLRPTTTLTSSAALVSHSNRAFHVPSGLPARWHSRPRPPPKALPSRQRQISLTAPRFQDPSTPSNASRSPVTRLPLDEDGRLDSSVFSKLPFRFDTGIALFAKRSPRPFPPPYLSPPSGSFSDPLSTHDRSRDRRRAYVGGQLIQGLTNGDDAVFASDYFIGANDGVGAWSTRPRGHAGLWSRLILHFWATAMFEDAARQGGSYRPDPVAYLQRAYEQTIEATGPPNDWQGTTTAAGAQLHYRRRAHGNSSKGAANRTQDGPGDNGDGSGDDTVEPLLYVTNLGDSQVMVVRPATRQMVYKSTEQWHWFDCPRQLGTNSPDTPANCAVVDEVPIREGDVVLAMSDGVIDNLWGHEIVEKVCESLERWRAGKVPTRRCLALDANGNNPGASGMQYVAEELMEAARVIAVDPFAESPFMEHAIEEGLASAGGKLDDISVVAAICKRNGG
ncbi:protein phosphatase PTC7 [Achaetomium macrosporum]|uniref:Protein phosphatase n=1 Tax=Achaetomium macrosporum TaxID=79813 RepID=A0AAN7C5K9_9PEZI|nr:protein phosphatase PTC7 [Achaetomium macrosporum]